jgi:ABC-2 type transport system ATP-binding protein
VAEGTTVLLTTQHLDEADQLAGRIAVIDHGRVIAEGTPGELKSSIGAGALRVRLSEPESVPAATRLLTERLGAPLAVEADGVTITTRVQDPDLVAAALAELAVAGIAVREFSLGQPSLDEVFLALTGKKTETEGAAAA